MTQPLHIATPLLYSRELSRAGQRVWLKMEALQPSGSFKLRGIGALCQARAQAGASRFISSSGGNAGLAAAYSGWALDLPVSVYVPRTTPDYMLAKLRRLGAEVIVAGAAWDEAHAVALDAAAEPGAAYIHPFDDPLLWAGHATMIDEVWSAGIKPAAVICAVGGGGLLCGIMQGLVRNGSDTIPVFAAETTGAASLNAAIKAGKPVSLPQINTVAHSLGAKQVALEAWRWTERWPIRSVLVSDDAAVSAAKDFANNQRVLVEPACGAAIAALAAAKDIPDGDILLIICGGAAIAPQL